MFWVRMCPRCHKYLTGSGQEPRRWGTRFNEPPTWERSSEEMASRTQSDADVMDECMARLLDPGRHFSC